ncbi:Fc.00g096870.m01.CDS01 [Cosmosporella sp. VM-42]
MSLNIRLAAADGMLPDQDVGCDLPGKASLDGAITCGQMQSFDFSVKDAHPSSRHERRKEYDLNITWEEYAPDGFSREMLLVNGRSPGPVLETDQDDRVVVRVQNLSPFNTTIHFHGIFPRYPFHRMDINSPGIEMEGTPWSDGTPGVSQHPIGPGNSFTYQFKATQHGSFWYHSHFLGQIEDGLYGPIIIRPRKSQPKPFQSISIDASTLLALEEAEQHVVPLVISDFVHLTSNAKWDMTLAARFEDSCYDSILFNGKGRVRCLPEDEVTSHLDDLQKAYLATVPGAAMTDKACFPPSVIIAFGGGDGNESALLPGTFSGCRETEGSVEVIKAHKTSCSSDKWTAIDFIGALNFMSGVVSIDEHDMWVYAMDGAYIEPQKVQAIVLGNGDRYSVLVKTHKAGDFKIRFNGNSVPQMMEANAILTVEGESDGSESKAHVNLVGLPLTKDVVYFNQSIAHPYPPDPPAQSADKLFHLSMKVDGASYLWAMNNTRLMPMDFDLGSPILFHPNPEANNNVTITTNYNDWVDLVLFASVFPMPPHPIHKHGTKMYHIGSGTGPFKWESVDEAIKEIPGQFNLVNPPRRDSFSSLPAIDDVSWVVVRYHASNPGAWLLHCHINNHLVGGMMMVIQDGFDRWPMIPKEYLDYGM